MDKQGIIKTFEAKAAAYIAEKNLLHRKAPVVVALSGGADSVALLALLKRLGYDCRAAHCNFHLRGEESMRDMRHCQELGRELDVDLYVRDFDVEARRRLYPGESVEMACRELRYAWFADLLDREGAQSVAVGHHREDRAETFMLNLMRGAGIAGLTSMNPRSGNVVRPLLPFSRDEIENYLSALGLTYIVDSSNASDAHRRNRLRNRVFPLLEELFPGASDAVLRSISHLESARTIFNEAVAERRKRYFTDNIIAVGELLANEAEPATLLFEFLRPLKFTYTQVLDIIAGAGASGTHFRSTDGAVVAELSHGQLELADASRIQLGVEECYSVTLQHDINEPVHITVSRHDAAGFKPERELGAAVAYIDARALDGNPAWELRHWRRGDRVVPFGSHSSKLVSDIFADAHFTASQKREAWLLTRNDEIIWLPGLRNSARYAISPDTRTYLRLELSQSRDK